MKTYDVFRTENRQGGSTHHVDTVQAETAEDAVSQVSAWSPPRPIEHMWAEESQAVCDAFDSVG